MHGLTARGTLGLYVATAEGACTHSPLSVDATPSLDPSDQRRAGWMAAAQAGDRRAYERVLGEAVPLIRATARRQGVPTDSVDDVVQETLLTVHRVRHTFDPSRSFDAWLTAIAARRAIDVLRGLGRHGRREINDDLAYENHPDRDDASRETQRSQDDARLHAAISTLPPGQREAVEQLALKEQSLAEAAQATGRTAGALKVNLHRALKALRDRIQGDA